eukprot:PhM_4_TR10039/c2_g3_i1/m.38725
MSIRESPLYSSFSLFVCLFLLLLLLLLGWGTESVVAYPREVDVYFHPCPPTVTREASQQLTTSGGVIARTWWIAARDLNITTRSIVNFETWDAYASAMLNASDNAFTFPTVFMSCTSVTEARGQLVNFSYPVVVENVVVVSVVPRLSVTLSSENIRSLVSAGLWYFVVSLGFGLLYYVTETRRTVRRMHHQALEESDGELFAEYTWKMWYSDIVDSVYFSFITTNTVGFGDLTPKSRLGRLITVLWISLSVLIVALFTATVLSALTPTDSTFRVTTASQLLGKRIGVKTKSAFSVVCQRLRVTCVESATSDELNQRLFDGDVDFVVMSLIEAATLIAVTKGEHKVMHHPLVVMSTHMSLASRAADDLMTVVSRKIISMSSEIASIRRQSYGTILTTSLESEHLPSFLDLLAEDTPLYSSVAVLVALTVFYVVAALRWQWDIKSSNCTHGIFAQPLSPAEAADLDVVKRGSTLKATTRRLERDVRQLVACIGGLWTFAVCISMLSVQTEWFRAHHMLHNNCENENDVGECTPTTSVLCNAATTPQCSRGRNEPYSVDGDEREEVEESKNSWGTTSASKP